jgi:hypothetical protein
MLRTAAIASLGLRRLLVTSSTAAAPGSQPSIFRFISGSVVTPEPVVRRFLPTLDLTRGYAQGRQSSFGDDDEPDDSDGDADGYEYSDKDEMDMDEGLDENRWDDAEELYDDSE